MRKSVRLRLALALLALSMTVIGAILFVQARVDKAAEAATQASLSPVSAPKTEVVKEPVEEMEEESVDFEALREINPEIVGWIRAQGLGIDEPIVRASDNAKYLTTNFEGEQDRSGAIFLDYACVQDFEEQHVVLYGHNLKAGGRFSPLIQLKKQEAFEQFQDDIVIYTPQREIPLRIVGVEAAPADGLRRMTDFESLEAFQQYALGYINGCTLSDSPKDGVNRLYSFITCSYEGEDYRTYIYAVERPVSEAEAESAA